MATTVAPHRRRKWSGPSSAVAPSSTNVRPRRSSHSGRRETSQSARAPAGSSAPYSAHAMTCVANASPERVSPK
eukprot:scaffold28677_cov112-Isochrysis_galbana.AAC.7